MHAHYSFPVWHNRDNTRTHICMICDASINQPSKTDVNKPHIIKIKTNKPSQIDNEYTYVRSWWWWNCCSGSEIDENTIKLFNSHISFNSAHGECVCVLVFISFSVLFRMISASRHYRLFSHTSTKTAIQFIPFEFHYFFLRILYLNMPYAEQEKERGTQAKSSTT